MNKIVIFCDGASKGNPGNGGYGVVMVVNDIVQEFGGAERNVTNNQMELMAGISALKNLPKNLNQNIEIWSDSSYVINGITKWVYGWSKNGWQTKTGSDVLNKGLWQELFKLSENVSGHISWHNLSGHSGIAGNERADEIASLLAMGTDPELKSLPLSKYGIDILNFSVNEEKLADKKEGRARSSAKAYSYLSMVDGNIEIHKTWDECKNRVNGQSKALYRKAVSASEEKQIAEEWRSARGGSA